MAFLVVSESDFANIGLSATIVLVVAVRRGAVLVVASVRLHVVDVAAGFRLTSLKTTGITLDSTHSLHGVNVGRLLLAVCKIEVGLKLLEDVVIRVTIAAELFSYPLLQNGRI